MSVSSIILAKLWGKSIDIQCWQGCVKIGTSVFILCWWDKTVQLFSVKLDNMYTSLKM